MINTLTTVTFLLVISFSSLSTLALADNTIKSLSEELTLNIGKEIYFFKTRDACVSCHGDITKSTKQADDEIAKIQKEKNSANLIKPSTWMAFRALGGKNKKEKNPNTFDNHLNEIVIQLIKNGAHSWNRQFYKKASDEFGFDWEKIKGKDSYDSQMKGINIAAQKIILKKISRTLQKNGLKPKRVELPDIAAYAVFRFVEKYNRE